MLGNAIDDAVYASITAKLNEMSDAERQKVSNAIYTWLSTETRKLPTADIPSKLEAWRGRIDRMCKELVFKIDGQKFEISASGDADLTLIGLTRGTDWFVGHPDLARLVVETVFSS